MNNTKLTYRQLQSELKAYKARGLTNIGLNSSYDVLIAEYEKLSQHSSVGILADVFETEKVKIQDDTEFDATKKLREVVNCLRENFLEIELEINKNNRWSVRFNCWAFNFIIRNNEIIWESSKFFRTQNSNYTFNLTDEFGDPIIYRTHSEVSDLLSTLSDEIKAILNKIIPLQ